MHLRYSFIVSVLLRFVDGCECDRLVSLERSKAIHQVRRIDPGDGDRTGMETELCG